MKKYLSHRFVVLEPLHLSQIGIWSFSTVRQNPSMSETFAWHSWHVA
jgi:hypothetical protein